MKEQKPIFVGIDWASEKHDVCVIDAEGNVLEERVFPHSGAGLAQLVQWLLSFVQGCVSQLQVAIEVNHGPVVATLLSEHIGVYSINPKQLDRFRDRFNVAGAKDDKLDARVLADSLRTDMPLFRQVALRAGELTELREYLSMHEDVTEQRVRLGNQIRAQLSRYYPQMLKLSEKNMTEPWLLELWKRVPTPAIAKHKRRGSIETLLKKHRIRRLDADTVLTTLKQPPLTVAPGTTAAACAHIHMLIEQLVVVNRQCKQIDRQMDVQLKQVGTGPAEDEPGQRVERCDVEILQSLPGVGRIVLATLLCEATEAIAARDYHRLRTFSGSAPVTRRSGKSLVVMQRRACNGRLSRGIGHWARVAVQHDELTRAKYQALRARGHGQHRALRSLGDRLLMVACAMLKNQQLYDAQYPKVRAHSKAA